MSSVFATMIMGLLAKFGSAFFAEVLSKGLLIFAGQTPNKYDDVVAEATAKAWGMPVDEIKKYMEKVEEK